MVDNSADRQKRTTQLIFNYSAGKMVPKLREPRNLYALSKDPGPQQAPRWPADVEVLRETVQHIDDTPAESEPFYQPSGFEKTPMPLPEGEGRVVYHHPLTHEEYVIPLLLFLRVGGNRNGPIPRAAKLKSSEDTTLIFESRFESGNLMKAIQVSEFEYELELRYDLYTHKHTQWFYFRFGNTRRNVRYRFTITNFMKSGSLYNSGMRPLMYSECNAQTKEIGWRRVGDDIKYYKNDVRLKNVKRTSCMHGSQSPSLHTTPFSFLQEKLRYRHGDRSSLHSAGRGGRQTLCRQEAGSLYSQDKNDVKNLKKTEYLEALTNAYLMSGILKPAPEETASLRYSTGSHGLGAQGLQLGQVEGLCPHHEKAFAEQFVANQLAGLSFADDKYNWSHTAVETRRPGEAAASYHSAPPRERHAQATPSDPIQLISTTAAHGHPVRAGSARRTPTRLAGSRRVSSPSKTIVSPADGVVEATGDYKKLGSEFVKRGVSSKALSLRSNGCATSSTYSVQETNKSMEAPRQPPPALVRHGGNVPSVAPDRPPSRGSRRPSNAMTPAGYQELLTRKGTRSEVRATQGIPLQLSVVMGTTHSTPSPNSDGADPTGAHQGQAQIIANPGSSITPVKKAESFFMASEVLTQPQLKGHIKDSLENAPSESAFMSPSSQNWPKTPLQAKNHNCTTEATPISDPALYAQQNITPSSHHFKKAQDFYGGRSSPSPSQPERHPSPISMGSAARLQAKYGRKSASAVHSGETHRNYRGSLKPASRSVDPNNNNSNTGMSTSTDDAGSNGIQSTSEDIGDDGKALLPDQTSSDSRSERIDGDYYYSEGIPSNAIEADGAQHNKGLTMNSTVETKLDIASRDINTNGQKVTAGQEKDYAKGTMSTHARRLDKKAELKHLEKSLEGDTAFTSSPDDVPSEGDLRVACNASTHLNKQSYKVTLSQSATATGHTHPSQGSSQITPRSRMDSTSPLQRSPRLLDRSTIQRGVDGSLHVRKPTPRERVKSGLATAQDLQDLGNGDVSELDVLISMDDNPYRVTLEQTPDTLIKETSPQPSARVTKPVTSGIYSPHSPRGRVTDPKRPLSSKRGDGSSPRQPDAHPDSRGDPHALQYFSVSKLSLQNRAFEKSPQPTPRSPSSNLHDGAVVSDHPHGTRPGAHRPKTQNSNKTTATGGRGGKGKRSPRPQAQKGQDSPHVVVTQGGFMGHRTQPGHLKVHYSKKK
nr:uncharacterized protein LOC129267764 [Lytechinus pictus]